MSDKPDLELVPSAVKDEPEKSREELLKENRILRTNVVSLKVFAKELQESLSQKAKDFFDEARQIMRLEPDGVEFNTHLKALMTGRDALLSQLTVARERVKALQVKLDDTKFTLDHSAYLRSWIADFASGKHVPTRTEAHAYLQVLDTGGKPDALGGTEPSGHGGEAP